MPTVQRRHYTDVELGELEAIAKQVTNPGAHWLKKPTKAPLHEQREYRAVGQHKGKEVSFAVFQRRSLSDKSDFSCGIRFLPADGSPIMLARYNGPSHRHGAISFRPHIHRATARAIAAGKRPESEAEGTERFSSVDGTLHCLAEDFRVAGIATVADNSLLPFPTDED